MLPAGVAQLPVEVQGACLEPCVGQEEVGVQPCLVWVPVWEEGLLLPGGALDLTSTPEVKMQVRARPAFLAVGAGGHPWEMVSIFVEDTRVCH